VYTIFQRVETLIAHARFFSRSLSKRLVPALPVLLSLSLSLSVFPRLAEARKNQPGCTRRAVRSGSSAESSSGRIETQLQPLRCGTATRRPSSRRGGRWWLDRSETTPPALHTVGVIRDESGTPRAPTTTDRATRATLSAEASRRSLRRLRRVPALIASCCALTAPPVPPDHPSTFLVRRPNPDALATFPSPASASSRNPQPPHGPPYEITRALVRGTDRCILRGYFVAA